MIRPGGERWPAWGPRRGASVPQSDCREGPGAGSVFLSYGRDVLFGEFVEEPGTAVFDSPVLGEHLAEGLHDDVRADGMGVARICSIVAALEVGRAAGRQGPPMCATWSSRTPATTFPRNAPRTSRAN